MTCPKCRVCKPSSVIPPKRLTLNIFCVVFTCGASQHCTADGQVYVPPLNERGPRPERPTFRFCLRCEQPFAPAHRQETRCRPCAKITTKENKLEWQRQHRDKGTGCKVSPEQRIAHEMSSAEAFAKAGT